MKAAPAMRRADSLDAFLRRPIGRYFGGASFVAWMHTASRVGITHFGTCEAADRAALNRLCDLALHPALEAPYDVIHDMSRVDMIDRLAYDMLLQFFGVRMRELVGRVRRIAFVRPPLLAGATYAGVFHDWVPDSLDALLFDDRDQALAWLGVAGAERAELEAALWPYDIGPVELRKTRALIAEDVVHANIEHVASKLGLSPRSLQRQLAQHGTSFSSELKQQQVAIARRLLVESADKLSAIAAALGFKSEAAFVFMFRLQTGETPARFRRRHRA